MVILSFVAVTGGGSWACLWSGGAHSSPPLLLPRLQGNNEITVKAQESHANTLDIIKITISGQGSNPPGINEITINGQVSHTNPLRIIKIQ